MAPKATFDAVDDFDGNYVPRDLRPEQTKEDLLRERIYSFRQGALLPAAGIFDMFRDILGTLYAHIAASRQWRRLTTLATSRVNDWSS